MPSSDYCQKYAHIPTLKVINDQLQAPGAALDERFLCLGFANSFPGRCFDSAQGFAAHRTGMMRETLDALSRTEKSDMDFVPIVRSMFCGYHDRQTLEVHCKLHLQYLWRNANAETRTTFLSEIESGHEDIFRYYARLRGCRVSDVKDAIKTEELVPEVVPEVSTGTDLILYEPKQDGFLARLRESVGMQDMYSDDQADDRQCSDGADAMAPGASKPLDASVDFSQLYANSIHKFPSQPIISSTNRNPETAPVETLDDSTNRFSDAALRDAALMKASRRAVSPLTRDFEYKEPLSGRTTPSVFTPGFPENLKAETPSSSTPSLLFQGKAGEDRDIRTPKRMTPRLRSDEKPAKVSVEDTPTPLAKKAGSSGMETDLLTEPHHQRSPSLAQPPPLPANPSHLSARAGRPTEAATSPTQCVLLIPGYTPRSETPKSIAYDIRDILRRPINYDNKGFIYVLKAPSFFDQFPPSRDRAEPEQWVKIGITQNIKERMYSLTGRCGMTDLTECGENDGINEDPQPMPTLRRVEELCHKELQNFKRPLNCKLTSTQCDTIHREWFNVTEETAIRTVRRWLKFFEQSPYTTSGILKSGFWDERVWNGEYLRTGREEDVDRTHERYQSWLEASIQRNETKIAEEMLNRLNVGNR